MRRVYQVLDPDYSIFQAIWNKYIKNAEDQLFNEATAIMLDEAYVNDWSAEKIITKAVERKLVDGELPAADLEKLADKIWLRFQRNWEHYFEYLSAEYNPIDNYSMYQKETPDLTTTTDTKTNTDLTVESDGDQNTNITTEDQVYGFNSSSPVDSNKSTTIGNKDDNKTHSKTTTTGDWDDNKVNEVRKEEGTRELERRGNIGVTTTAQMLTGDSGFWQNWDIVSSIFRDVDKVITLMIY